MNTATVNLETNAGSATIEVEYANIEDLVNQAMETAAHMERRWASNYDEPSEELADRAHHHPILERFRCRSCPAPPGHHVAPIQSGRFRRQLIPCNGPPAVV